MSIAVWIAVALVCFVLPAVALTQGGSRAPGRDELAQHAKRAGLPLTDEVAGPVVERIRRRERGMSIGGIGVIVVGGLAAIVLDGSETWGSLVVLLAGAGTAFGGAWTMARHHPAPTTDRPVVARLRSSGLADYLTRGERFGFWVAPAVLVLGVAPGVLLFRQLPAEVRGPSITIGLVGTGVALLAWLLAALLVRSVLAAPARSGSDLELAWDDAERALGLRQVANLMDAVACLALGLWLVLMAQSLTTDGFYREPSQLSLTYALTIVSVLIFGGLIAVVAVGPAWAWIGGERQGYEQRRLWPNGVRLG